MASPNMSKDDVAKLGQLAKGAFDTALGLGVLGLQKLQVGRVEVAKRLTANEAFGPRYQSLRVEALRQAGRLDALLTEARHSMESSLRPMTEHLPESARHVTTLAQSRLDQLHLKVSACVATATEHLEEHHLEDGCSDQPASHHDADDHADVHPDVDPQEQAQGGTDT